MNIKGFVKDNKVVIEISKEYLVNAFYIGVTTNCTGVVSDEERMLTYFAHILSDSNNDSYVGRCIDSICEDALDNGESFVTPDEY